jgi:hypothetical protein
MDSPPRALRFPALLVAAVLGGCADESPLVGGAGPIPTDVTTPAAAVESHARALAEMDADAYVALLEKRPADLHDPVAVVERHARSIEWKNHAAYSALLAPDFEFFPRDDDLVDFPWLPGTSWDLATELDIMRNMMDPRYSGNERPVRTMRFEYTILNQRVIVGDVPAVELTMNADVTVLVARDLGWFSDTRFIFLLVEDADGWYRIRSIREIQVLEPHASVDESSFGSIKGLYR